MRLKYAAKTRVTFTTTSVMTPTSSGKKKKKMSNFWGVGVGLKKIKQFYISSYALSFCRYLQLTILVNDVRNKNEIK